VDDGTLHPVYTHAALTPPMQSSAFLADRADGDIDAWAPVVSGEVIGWAYITYSLAEARAVRPRILKDAALAATAAILLNLWLLLLYLRRPLRAIRLATEFSNTLNTRRGDEIAVNAETVEIEQLQRSLNFASQQLWQEHRAMTESAERLQAVLTYTADGLVTLGEQGIIESCNPAAERIFGHSSEAMKGRGAELFVPDWRSARPGQRHETSGRRADGSLLPLELSIAEMWVGNQRLYTATVRDLSDIKRLEQLSSRLGRILEHSSNEIYIFDAQTLHFVQVSEGALTNLGYRMDELLDLTPIDIKPGMTREQFTTIIQPLRDGGQNMAAFETVHAVRTAQLYPVEVRLQLSRTETRRCSWPSSRTSPRASMPRHDWYTSPITTRSPTCRIACCSASAWARRSRRRNTTNAWSRCCSSTSTASRSSTIRSGTTAATNCSRSWRGA
jgi:PAS domain S-box-containing protein